MLSRICLGLGLAAALLAGVPAAAITIGFSSTVSFTTTNPFGLAAGDVITGQVSYDEALAPTDPFGVLTPAEDPSLRFSITLGSVILTEMDAMGPGESFVVELSSGAFFGFSFIGLTGEPFPGAGFSFPLVGITLTESFFGGAQLDVNNLASFVGPTPVPFASGPATVSVVPEPASLALLGLGLAGLAAIRRRSRGENII